MQHPSAELRPRDPAWGQAMAAWPQHQPHLQQLREAAGTFQWEGLGQGGWRRSCPDNQRPLSLRGTFRPDTSKCKVAPRAEPREGAWNKSAPQQLELTQTFLSRFQSCFAAGMPLQPHTAHTSHLRSSKQPVPSSGTHHRLLIKGKTLQLQHIISLLKIDPCFGLQR